jgi:hypothetical protein
MALGDSGMATKLLFVGASITLTALLSGCTTFGFAPPSVEVGHSIDRATVGECTSMQKSDNVIARTPPGALELIENFLLGYRCAAKQAASDRIGFEVPSFLATITAVLGPTYGLTNDGVIAAAGGAAVADRANSYFAPKEKAALLDSALDAILCVKTESVGIAYFDTTKPAPQTAAVQTAADSTEDAADAADALRTDLQKQLDEVNASISANSQPILAPMSGDDGAKSLAAGQEAARQQQVAELGVRKQGLEQTLTQLLARIAALRIEAAKLRSSIIPDDSAYIIEKTVNGRVVEFNIGRQYFEMVSAALFSIERVLASRISSVGSFDSEGISAQFKQLVETEAEAEQQLAGAENSDVPDPNAPKAVGQMTRFASEGERNAVIAELSLEVMQPRLQQCVVRAKI